MSGALSPAPSPAGADPMAGGAAPDTAGDTGGDADSGSDVLVTIASDGQGGFLVYAGDEPDSGSGDMSSDDTDAMGAAGAAPAPPGGASPQGQPADSIGAALKITLTILQENQSSQGAPGDADSQFAGGFNASKSPTPVGMGGKASSMAQKF